MPRTAVIILLAAVMMLPIGIYLSAQVPCDGKPIEVLNDDPCGLGKWIAVEDSVTICQILCLMEADPEKCGIIPVWIGGVVYADEGAEHGFNFDPGTVVIAEITAETYQTNTCQIREDPKYYDGGLWYIPANFRDTRAY